MFGLSACRRRPRPEGGFALTRKTGRSGECASCLKLSATAVVGVRSRNRKAIYVEIALGPVDTMRSFVPCQGGKPFYEGSVLALAVATKEATDKDSTAYGTHPE